MIVLDLQILLLVHKFMKAQLKDVILIHQLNNAQHYKLIQVLLQLHFYHQLVVKTLVLDIIKLFVLILIQADKLVDGIKINVLIYKEVNKFNKYLA